MMMDFAKAGNLSSARDIFDRIAQRDVVSWNSMISIYNQNGQYGQALQMFSHMRRDGIKQSPTSFSIILSSCARLGSLLHGKWIHGLLIKTGLLANEYVSTSLLTMYAECGVPDCLMKIFNDFDHHNVASWNALISGFVSNHRVSEAQQVFDWMPSRNIISWTAMIRGYVESGKIKMALELFEMMPAKNKVTWSVMLGGFVCNDLFEESLTFFSNMIANGIQVSGPSIISVLSACSGLQNGNQGRKIHCYIVKLGFSFDKGIEASLVTMYFRCLEINEAKSAFEKMDSRFVGSWNSLVAGFVDNNDIDVARKWFDKMSEKDEISWDLMINGYLRNNRLNDALELLFLMPKPAIKTYNDVIVGFIKNGKTREAWQLFNTMPKKDVVAYTTMIFGLVRKGFLDDALRLFKSMPVRNVVTYNVMISGLALHGMVKQAYVLFYKCPEQDVITWNALIIGFVQGRKNIEAFQSFRKMIRSGVRPNISVVASLLSASANICLLCSGKLMHEFTVKYGYDSNLVVANSLISMYTKCGNVHAAKLIFDQMDGRDVVTWNSIIYGYAVNGHGSESIEMFERMKTTETKPDGITFLGVLFACAQTSLLEDAQHYFNTMMCDHGIAPTIRHYACIIDLLCRKGLVEEAEKLICSMPFEPDPILWTTVMNGCRFGSNVRLADFAIKRISTLAPEDPMPYMHLSQMYAYFGGSIDFEKSRNQTNTLWINKRPGCSWIEVNG